MCAEAAMAVRGRHEKAVPAYLAELSAPAVDDFFEGLEDGCSCFLAERLFPVRSPSTPPAVCSSLVLQRGFKCCATLRCPRQQGSFGNIGRKGGYDRIKHHPHLLKHWSPVHVSSCQTS